MAAVELPTSERLLEGAKQIGAAYRAGARCATMGWKIAAMEGVESCEAQIDPEELCKCGKKATLFCKAKIKWLILAMSEPRDIEVGDYGFALTMKASEWDATGLTITWEAEGLGKVKVGPKGSFLMKNLAELAADPVSGMTTLKLMKSFPGAKMEFEKMEVKAAAKEGIAAE